MKKKRTWKRKNKHKAKKQRAHQYGFTNENWYKRLNEFFNLT